MIWGGHLSRTSKIVIIHYFCANDSLPHVTCKSMKLAQKRWLRVPRMLQMRNTDHAEIADFKIATKKIVFNKFSTSFQQASKKSSTSFQQAEKNSSTSQNRGLSK